MLPGRAKETTSLRQTFLPTSSRPFGDCWRRRASTYDSLRTIFTRPAADPSPKQLDEVPTTSCVPFHLTFHLLTCGESALLDAPFLAQGINQLAPHTSSETRTTSPRMHACTPRSRSCERLTRPPLAASLPQIHKNFQCYPTSKVVTMSVAEIEPKKSVAYRNHSSISSASAGAWYTVPGRGREPAPRPRPSHLGSLAFFLRLCDLLKGSHRRPAPGELRLLLGDSTADSA